MILSVDKTIGMACPESHGPFVFPVQRGGRKAPPGSNCRSHNLSGSDNKTVKKLLTLAKGIGSLSLSGTLYLSENGRLGVSVQPRNG